MTRLYSVLAVDDEIMVKKTLKKLLLDAGRFAWAGEAEDGAEALELIGKLKPDIVITDIRMPGMDGLELIEALQGRQSGPEVVILSGYGDFSFVQHAIRYGAADYLLKPISPTQLAQTMERVVARLRAKDPPQTERWRWLPECERLARELAEQVRRLDENGVAAELQRAREAAPPGELPLFCADLLQLTEAELKSGGAEVEHAAVRADMRLEDGPDAAISGLSDILAVWMEGIRRRRNWGNHKLIRQALEHLERQYADPGLSMQQFAAALNVSPAYFSRTFKAETGRTFVQFLTEKRLEQVKRLLADPALTAGEAAGLTGYADYPHFAKAFKRQFGLSPTEYRKRLGIQ